MSSGVPGHNISQPRLKVEQFALVPYPDEKGANTFASLCPVCGEGKVEVWIEPSTRLPSEFAHCLFCHQHFQYTDMVRIRRQFQEYLDELLR